MQNKGIIRNRRKIEAIINNAKSYLEFKKEQSFSDYLWQFVDGKQIVNQWQDLKNIPANTEQSDLMAKTLKKRGFKFVGSTISYAFMQATGMVNDHVMSCFRHGECLQ
jgi:DNA-3-methyladenine glycosylase I